MERDNALHATWGSFLAEFEWDWFATFTFRYRTGPDAARRSYRQFTSSLETSAGEPIGWFVIEEIGALGRFHMHALILNVSALSVEHWRRAWHSRYGEARIVRFEPTLGAAYYCAKNILGMKTEYDFSDNLTALKRRKKKCSVL
jgi:hypothetical protein